MPKLETENSDFAWRSPTPRKFPRPAEEDTMLKRIAGLVVVALLVFSAPVALPQQEQAQTVYTFVSLWQIPRANWAQFSENNEKITDPILQHILADGTIISWGIFET